MLFFYDMCEILWWLVVVIVYFDLICVIVLGDSFYDFDVVGCMVSVDCEILKEFVLQCECWIWIEGNYDFELLEDLGGEVLYIFELGWLILCYELVQGEVVGEICGYLYFCVKVCGQGWLVCCFVFVMNGKCLILLVFGVYMGGLNVCDLVIVEVFGVVFSVFVLGWEWVYVIVVCQLVFDCQ